MFGQGCRLAEVCVDLQPEIQKNNKKNQKSNKPGNCGFGERMRCAMTAMSTGVHIPVNKMHEVNEE